MATRRGVGQRPACILVLAAAAACSAASSAWAEVRISDSLSGGTLVVEARDATVQEVLDALARSRHLEIHSPAPLTRVITGTYSGSLQRVLSRVLDGYDNVVQSSSAGVRLSVFGVAGASRSPASRTAVAAAPPPVVSANTAVSDNLDRDDEAAQQQAGLAVAPPAPVRPATGPAAGASAVAALPSHPAVSGNVDLDEEMSTR